VVAVEPISMTKSLDGADSTDNDRAFRDITPSFSVLVAKSKFNALQHAVSILCFVANIFSSVSKVP
jgi:hypothetical protein